MPDRCKARDEHKSSRALSIERTRTGQHGTVHLIECVSCRWLASLPGLLLLVADTDLIELFADAIWQIN